MTLNVSGPSVPNYTTSDGDEVHRDPPPPPPPPPDGPHSDGVDMSAVDHDYSQDYSPNPPPPTPQPAAPPPPPEKPPLELDLSIEVDGTAIVPQSPGMGGQAGVQVGISTSTGPYIDTIHPANEPNSVGGGAGVSVSGSVSVGYPTSQPATVVSISIPPISISGSYAPGDDGGFGTVQVQVGGAAKAGAYVTQTETTNVIGRDGPVDLGEDPTDTDMRAGQGTVTDGGVPDDPVKARGGVDAGDDVSDPDAVDDSDSASDDEGLEAPDPIVPSIRADSTDGRAY
jgi:hypothetical protein